LSTDPKYSSSSTKPARENCVCIAVPVEHMKLSGLFQTHKHFLPKRDLVPLDSDKRKKERKKQRNKEREKERKKK
jgi:hypothetical protein